jgi:hypothetical protein
MRRCEYIGNITELRGQTALVMPLRQQDRDKHPKGTIQAQFDEVSLIFNNKRMGLCWNPFPETHFREVRDGDKPYFQPLL